MTLHQPPVGCLVVEAARGSPNLRTISRAVTAMTWWRRGKEEKTDEDDDVSQAAGHDVETQEAAGPQHGRGPPSLWPSLTTWRMPGLRMAALMILITMIASSIGLAVVTLTHVKLARVLDNLDKRSLRFDEDFRGSAQGQNFESFWNRRFGMV